MFDAVLMRFQGRTHKVYNVSLSNDKDLYQSDRITDLNVREIGQDRNPFIEFTVDGNLTAGTYTETIYYYFECDAVNENGELQERIARSEPVTYTVTYTVE